MRVNDWYNQRADIYRGANAHTGARRSADYNPILLSFNDPERDSRERDRSREAASRQTALAILVPRAGERGEGGGEAERGGEGEGRCSREAAAMEIAPRRSRSAVTVAVNPVV